MDLTNREIATLIWLAIFIAGACSIRTVRQGLGVVFRILFGRPILGVLISALFYITLCIFALERLGLWEFENAKTTLFWGFSFAFLSVLDFKRLMEDRMFFRSILREILSLTVILVFLADSYTFGLIAELVIIPIATALAWVQAIPAKKPEEQRVQGFVSNLLALLGIGYLAHSAYQAYVDWTDFATISTARDFAIPLLLSLMFLPFLYWLRLRATYEQVFTGLNFAISDKKLLAYARLRSVLAFRQNLDLLKRWRRMMLVEQPTNKRAIRDSFDELRLLRRIEKDPPHVPPEEGWSPYAAKQFLEAEGIETDDYHRSFHDEWRCSSPPVKVSEGPFEPTITYYVSGSASAAKELALELNVFHCEDPTAADERFGRVVAILLGRASSPQIAREIAQAMGDGETADVRSDNVRVQLTREDWSTNSGVSYERSFTITRDLSA
jgi:hypothetical protein